MRGVTIDITVQKHAENVVRESDGTYCSLVEVSPDAVYVHVDRKITYINAAGVQPYGGQSSEDFIDKEGMDFLHPGYKNTVLDRVYHRRDKN